MYTNYLVYNINNKLMFEHNNFLLCLNRSQIIEEFHSRLKYKENK